MKLGRRDFLKWSAAAGTAATIGVGTAAAMWPSAASATPRIEAWRARPGTPLRIVLEEDVPGVERRAARVEVQLVEIDARGDLLRRLMTTELIIEASGRWTAQIPAPESAVSGRESYLLAVAFVDVRGRVAVSKSAEIVCLPIHAGL